MALPRASARPAATACAALAALLLAACGTAVSTSSFKGEQHAVAQVLANFQSEVAAGEDKKICTNDLAAALVSRLGAVQGCEGAIKRQREQVDNPRLEVKEVQISGSAAHAKVTSIRSGKTAVYEMTLVKERGGWRISGLQ